MKNKLATVLAVIVCIVLLTPTVFAANQVPEMEIDVALLSDGSAQITQIWTTDTDEGTEFYLARNDSGYLSITDFSVSDNNGAYAFVENWAVNASFEEKANKCGIVETDTGVELCWGVSQYGENRYTIRYIVHGLVGSFSDADGFNHRFVDEMSFFPTNVVLTIRNQDGTPLNDDICDIWGFGYEGQVAFEDGAIRAWSEAPLESGNHMTIMVALQKGVLTPDRSIEDSFETVKDRAFDGSDYDEDLTLDEALFVLCAFAVPVVIVILANTVSKKITAARNKRRMEKAGYFRDVPNDGNLNVTYKLGLCSGLCEEDTLLGAYLMRLISQGCLENTDDSIDAKTVRLQLRHNPESGNPYEDALYTILEAAAGKDGILDPNELGQFCTRNYVPLSRFMESCQKDGIQTLIQGGCLKRGVLETIKHLTSSGQKELDEILGLKHFLLDFSLIQERGIAETVIWQDYMVYALMLGIADKLESQIRELYPEQLPQVEQYRRYVHYTGYYNGVMFSAYSRERQLRAARSSGSGGRASFGGGGGFSGGGGGGTR